MTQQYVPLRGEHPAHRAAMNRRASFRYGCPPATPTQVSLVAEPGEPVRGWAVDLSTKGIGIYLPGPLETGAFGIVRIKSADSKRTYELAAHVAHSSLQANGEWLVGFAFVKYLEETDLDELL
ncbi:MAG: PilZ domain-containing protein [Planctomycetes bacterium]|nr:PilZ domain-containing protein [Planctomycetota bacterium]